MNLYLIEHPKEWPGYDAYDSAVVAAVSEEAAMLTHPSPGYEWHEGSGKWRRLFNGSYTDDWGSWTRPDTVKATLIGTSVDDEAGVVCASFSAG